MHRISVERANVFLIFSGFPTDSVPHPEFWKIFFGFILYPLKEFQFFRCLRQEYWECQAKTPRGYWWHALRACSPLGSGAAGSSQRDVHSEESVDWEVEQFALVLRSLRAVPGVWRLPVWEQADDINSEFFSLLGSWSLQTRIHKELTHNFVEPCAEYWSPFIKLECRQRSGQS